MKKQTTTTYTDTFAPSSIIDDQWGADEAMEILGWKEDDSDDDSEEEDDSDDYDEEDYDEEDYSDDYGEEDEEEEDDYVMSDADRAEDRALCPECYYD